MMRNKTIGIIGCGNMGSAIAEQIKQKFSLFVFDKNVAKLSNLFGVNIAENSVELIKQCDVVILALKPQDFDVLLHEIKAFTQDKLIISVAAGITTRYIEKILSGARVIRCMPNLAVRVAAGVVCLFKGNSASKKDLDLTGEILSSLTERGGVIEVLDNEELLHGVTAVSGSGPGFFFHLIESVATDKRCQFAQEEFIPSLAASAEKCGFSHRQAQRLAQATSSGSMVFLEQTKLKPKEAKKMVASPKGTTEAGLDKLQKGGTLNDAVEAALKRAKELANTPQNYTPGV